MVVSGLLFVLCTRAGGRGGCVTFFSSVGLGRELGNWRRKNRVGVGCGYDHELWRSPVRPLGVGMLATWSVGLVVDVYVTALRPHRQSLDFDGGTRGPYYGTSPCSNCYTS